MNKMMRMFQGIGHLQSMTAEGYHSLVTDEFEMIAAVSDDESMVMPGTASSGRAAAAYDEVQMSFRVAALATTNEAAATRAERVEGIAALFIKSVNLATKSERIKRAQRNDEQILLPQSIMAVIKRNPQHRTSSRLMWRQSVLYTRKKKRKTI